MTLHKDFDITALLPEPADFTLGGKVWRCRGAMAASAFTPLMGEGVTPEQIAAVIAKGIDPEQVEQWWAAFNGDEVVIQLGQLIGAAKWMSELYGVGSVPLDDGSKPSSGATTTGSTSPGGSDDPILRMIRESASG